MRPADVLLLTTDVETVAAVRAVMQSGSVQGKMSVCKGITEFRACLAKPAADRTRAIAIVDVDSDPQQILCDLAKTNTARPGMVSVVTSREFEEQLVLEAMQAGARHFLRKSAIATELDTVLEKLLVNESQAKTQAGNVISVFSCSGGCGATTVAVNLAAELRLASQRPVLLVDLDPHYGSAAQYLSVKGEYGVAQMLNREGAIDRHLVESSVVQVSENLDVLLSPAVAEADRHQPMNYDHLCQVLEACCESHRYVVVDAPRLPQQAAVDLASVSRAAVIVMRLTVRDVTFAKGMIAQMKQKDMAPDHVLIVANQFDKRGALLNAVEVQRVLGVKPLFRVRTDLKRAIRSNHYGKPLAQFAPFSGLRRDFRRVARRVGQWTSNGRTGRGGA